MLSRINIALHSKNPLQRLVHFLAGSILFKLPEGLRRRLFNGQTYYCPLCDAHLSTFVRLYRVYNLYCPVCASMQRQRGLWLFIQRKTNLLNGAALMLLHIAPERAIGRRLQLIEGLDYVTGDLDESRAMLKIDIADLQFPDNSFDVVLCSHVLEHVPDDRKAMRELARITRPDGYTIIVSPISARVTREDPTITDPVVREKLFKQHDHVRRYGPDFIQRLEQNGFSSQLTKVEDMVAPREIQRLGLSRADYFFLCRKQPQA